MIYNFYQIVFVFYFIKKVGSTGIILLKDDYYRGI